MKKSLSPKLGSVVFFENFSVSSNVPDKMPMILSNHFCDFTAVYNIDVVMIDYL